MPAHGRADDDRPAFDDRQFRDALAQFATGVTIVCARAPNERYVGFTANSFNSVSLEPPLVLWSIARKSASLGAFDTAERYAVNVLAADQAELARRFSRTHGTASRASRTGWAGPTHRSSTGASRGSSAGTTRATWPATTSCSSAKSSPSSGRGAPRSSFTRENSGAQRRSAAMAGVRDERPRGDNRRWRVLTSQRGLGGMRLHRLERVPDLAENRAGHAFSERRAVHLRDRQYFFGR